MDERTRKNIEAAIAEQALRLGVPAMQDEKNQAEIDRLQAQLLRDGLRYRSVDDIEKFLKGGK